MQLQLRVHGRIEHDQYCQHLGSCRCLCVRTSSDRLPLSIIADFDRYLGAAPLIKDKGILSTAASIATIEARHQTFIRVAGSKEPIPAAFDNALGPRAVFTLASPFFESCPEGSDLGIKPFPAITVAEGSEAVAGSRVEVQAEGGDGEAQFCAFVTE